MLRVSPQFRSPFRRGESAAESDDPVEDDVTAAEGDATISDEVDLKDDEQGEWLAYELHAWASETRSMLAQLLIADQVVHSWQGTTLLAHESVEAEVDALIEEVEAAADPELDPEAEQTAFEMAGWSGELQALLSERLGQAGVAHEFDGDGDLVCHEADEEQVELVIEDLLARSADEGLEELEGLEANELLSALFEATDRLRRDVHDSNGVMRTVEHGRRLAGVATPFGFAATAWASLRESAGTLADLLESDDGTDEEIVTLAAQLRDTLHRVI